MCVGVKWIINQRECAQPSVRYRKERKRWRPIGDDGLIDTIQAFAGLTLVDCHHSKIRRRGRPPTYTAVARDSRRIHPSIHSRISLFLYCHLFIFIKFFFPFSFSVYLLDPPFLFFLLIIPQSYTWGNIKKKKEIFLGRRHRGRHQRVDRPLVAWTTCW